MKKVPSAYHFSKHEIEEERSWIEASQKDVRAFTPLYDRYFSSIFSFVMRRVGNEQDAGEVTSDTFYRAMINIGKYEFRGLPFSAWLYRIAINELNRFYRRNRHESILEVDEEQFREVVQHFVPDIHDGKLSSILSALEDLSKEMLEILELRFFEGKSFSEISYILDIGESAAKMRTYRALDKVKSVIRNGNGNDKE